jgi:hypothetical protein
MQSIAIAAVSLGLTCAGCGANDTASQLFNVTGTVVVKTGRQPLTQGTVEFAHQTDPNYNARSDIDTAGNFRLYTIVGNKKLPGAGEGEYVVTISLPQGSDQVTRSAQVKKTYRVEAKDNRFEIVLERRP